MFNSTPIVMALLIVSVVLVIFVPLLNLLLNDNAPPKRHTLVVFASWILLIGVWAGSEMQLSILRPDWFWANTFEMSGIAWMTFLLALIAVIAAFFGFLDPYMNVDEYASLKDDSGLELEDPDDHPFTKH